VCGKNIEDGKAMDLATNTLTIKDLVEEMDRHSRTLLRKEELGGN